MFGGLEKKRRRGGKEKVRSRQNEKNSIKKKDPYDYRQRKGKGGKTGGVKIPKTKRSSSQWGRCEGGGKPTEGTQHVKRGKRPSCVRGGRALWGIKSIEAEFATKKTATFKKTR